MKGHLKVLIVSAGYKPAFIYGGPTYSISALAESLTSQGNDITVMTTNANGKHDFPYKNGTTALIDGVHTIYYRRITGDPTSVSFTHTRALIRSIRQYDLVHIQGWWNWVAMISLIVCKHYKVPHLLSPRGALSEYTFKTERTSVIKKWIHQLFFKGMLSKTLLHVTSHEEERKFRKVLPRAKVVVVPNIVPLPEQVTRTTPGNGPLQLVFLGRIDQVKNLELLLDTLKEVSFRCHLSIAGTGDPDYIAQLKARTGGNPHITWLGQVTGNAKFELLANSDILVLLSHTENFGNVVIEALSQGTAVLLSNHVGAAEMVSTYNLGWVIPSAKNICIDTLHQININRDQLKDIRERAPQVIQSEFNPSVMAERYMTECYHLVHPKFGPRIEKANLV
jgi:glycosyltransferase involved in cell wall biosynthesis